MMLPDLPWTIGPVPLILTTWSAFVLGRTVAFRRALKVGSGNIASSFMLSLAFSAFFMQALFSRGGVEVSILFQFITAAFCCIITYIVNFFSIEDSDFPKKDLSWTEAVKAISACAPIFLFFNILYLIVGVDGHCSGPKCHALSYLFGRKDGVFSTLYLGLFLPTLFLTLSIFIVIPMLKRLLFLRAR